MKLTFKLTTEDVIRFNQYHLKHTTGFIRRYFPYIIFLAFVAYILYKSWNNFTPAVFMIIAVTAALFGLLILANRLILRWHIKRIVKKNPGLTGAREIEISGDRLHYRFHDKENVYELNELSRIDPQKHAIYILDQNGFAIIAPHHAFKTESERRDFLNMVRSRM